jgi:hypothetical protein
VIELQNGQQLHVTKDLGGFYYHFRLFTNDVNEFIDARYVQKDVVFKYI